MLVVANRRYKKQYVIGGGGIFGSILQFLAKAFTSQTAKHAAKEVGKAALDVGKHVAADAGKKLIEKAIQSKTSGKKKLENIVTKYTSDSTKGSAVRIENLVKRLNGSGLKQI